MNFIEFIGFIITMVAMFFLVIKRSREEKFRREHPEEYEAQLQKQEHEFKQLLKTMNLEEEEDEEEFEEEEYVEKKPVSLPPVQAPEEQYAVFTNPYFEPHDPVGFSHGHEAYKIQSDKVARGRQVLSSVKSIQDAVVLSEIIGKPKGL